MGKIKEYNRQLQRNLFINLASQIKHTIHEKIMLFTTACPSFTCYDLR